MAKRDEEKREGYENVAHSIADHGMTAEEEANAAEKERQQRNREVAKEVKQAEKAEKAETGDSGSSKEASS